MKQHIYASTGVVRGTRAYRASRTLLVYTSACAWTEINLGNAPGDESGFVQSTFSQGSIKTSKIAQTSVLLTGYLASSTIHSC